ncbi:hypothetical protein [Kribbella pratensis]|uniref:hypothetical protein n=1 Tax=Kribbella pratensis TaxID=2512112 RepID=UPI001EDE8913|nr:hypothetical protein [Kribbella pratensis]
MRAIRPLGSRRRSRARGNDPVGTSASARTRNTSPASIENSVVNTRNAIATPFEPVYGGLPTSALAIGLNRLNVMAAASTIRTTPNRTPSNRCATGTKITRNTPRLNNPATTTSMPGTIGAGPGRPAPPHE